LVEGLAAGLAAGLGAGLTAGLAAGLGKGLAAGLATSLAAGLAAGLGAGLAAEPKAGLAAGLTGGFKAALLAFSVASLKARDSWAGQLVAFFPQGMELSKSATSKAVRPSTSLEMPLRLPSQPPLKLTPLTMPPSRLKLIFFEQTPSGT
jgi:hypothetical protein